MLRCEARAWAGLIAVKAFSAMVSLAQGSGMQHPRAACSGAGSAACVDENVWGAPCGGSLPGLLIQVLSAEEDTYENSVWKLQRCRTGTAD